MRNITRAVFTLSIITAGVLAGTAQTASASNGVCPSCQVADEELPTTTTPPSTTTPVPTTSTLPAPTLTTPTLPAPTLPAPTLPTPTFPPGNKELTQPTLPPLTLPVIPPVELVVPTVPDAKDIADDRSSNGGSKSISTSTQPIVSSVVETTPSAEPVDSMGADRVATTWNWPLILILGLVIGTLWGWFNQHRARLIVVADEDEEETTPA